MKAALLHVAKHDFALPVTEVHKLALCRTSKKAEYYVTGTEPSGSCANGTGIWQPSYSATAAPDKAPAALSTVAPVAAAPRVQAPPRRVKAAAAPPAAERAGLSSVDLETPEAAAAEKGGH
jgi:hypothetical protein